MKNAFGGLIGRLDTAKETISELIWHNMTTETSKTKSKDKKDWKNQNRISKNCGQLDKV